MKVERKSDWPPIVITLESREEAVEFWHRLNLNSESAKYHMKHLMNEELSYKMWDSFDRIFNPEINRVLFEEE